MTALLASWHRRDAHATTKGQGLAEYALILALIAVIAIVALIFSAPRSATSSASSATRSNLIRRLSRQLRPQQTARRTPVRRVVSSFPLAQVW